MKILLAFMFISSMSIVILTGCSSNADRALEPTPYATVNDLKGVTAMDKDGTLTANGLTIRYQNGTDSEFTYGEAYVIEQKINDEWYQVPYATDDDVAFIEIAYYLFPKATVEWTTDWESIYGSLETGEYRLVKAFLAVGAASDYETYYIATEFIID